MTIETKKEAIAVPQQNMIMVTSYADSILISEIDGSGDLSMISLSYRQAVRALVKALLDASERWEAP